MIICSAAAALAATLIAGPAAPADPAPSSGSSTGGAAPIAAQPDTVVNAPGYGPSGPDYGPAYAPVAMPVAAGAAPAMAPSEPKQAVYHLKSKDGVRHDVVVVPISDDPTKPITLPDFGFQKFTVTDKPRIRKSHSPAAQSHQASKPHQAGKPHRGKKHHGKAHRRHR